VGREEDVGAAGDAVVLEQAWTMALAPAAIASRVAAGSCRSRRSTTESPSAASDSTNRFSWAAPRWRRASMRGSCGLEVETAFGAGTVELGEVAAGEVVRDVGGGEK
jgi:hypothetical protein